mmetsp:Transcript_8795/g.7771  ORF Transcript_8795/g.7771 Transcript_8795/m.7771 type:complete len:88 (-) Transcript_8795:314-577(-)
MSNDPHTMGINGFNNHSQQNYGNKYGSQNYPGYNQQLAQGGYGGELGIPGDSYGRTNMTDPTRSFGFGGTKEPNFYTTGKTDPHSTE